MGTEAREQMSGARQNRPNMGRFSPRFEDWGRYFLKFNYDPNLFWIGKGPEGRPELGFADDHVYWLVHCDHLSVRP